MKKLLIADDEPLVLVGLQSMLKWEEHGIALCDTARNGEQALELIEKHHPDIVITDIKMPLKTGLEVVAESNDRFGRLPVFIVLTSYEEFGFVRDAIHLGAVEYLIKLELTPQRLADSVARAAARVDEIKGAEAPTAFTAQSSLQQFREKFFVRLYNNLFESRQQFERQRDDLHIDFSVPAYTVAACEISGVDTNNLSVEKLATLYASTMQMAQNTAEKFLTCYATSLDMRRFNLLFCLPQAWPDAQSRVSVILQKTGALVHNYFNVDLLCSVGTPVTDAYQVSESYRVARTAMTAATAGEPAVADNCRIADSTFNLAKYKSSLTRAFEELDADALYETITNIADCFVGGNASHIQAMDAAGSLLYMAISLLPEGEKTAAHSFDGNPDSYRSLYKLSSADSCAHWMLTLRDGLCETLQSRRQSYKERVVAYVKEYIRANLDKRLTLNDVAAAFSFSPNYLSQLFARYSDCGFVETITDAKINSAKAMLLTGDKKIYEIAENLGYESAFYFSKVFKKVTGQSPRDYMRGSNKQ